MTAARSISLSLLVLLVGCGSSESDGAGGASASTSSDASSSSGADSTSSGASQGGADEGGPLTDVELGLVGVWRGTPAGDDVDYFVLQEDRTGCTWQRQGDDYAQRYFELQFHDWVLGDAEPDGRRPISFVTAEGNAQDVERYDPETDRIHLAGVEEAPMSWVSITIPCSGAGSNATATDVERRGTYPDAE